MIGRSGEIESGRALDKVGAHVKGDNKFSIGICYVGGVDDGLGREQPEAVNEAPLVVSQLGVRLCRPSEAVLDILPSPQQGAFTKEDGEQVADVAGKRIA